MAPREETKPMFDKPEAWEGPEANAIAAYDRELKVLRLIVKGIVAAWDVLSPRHYHPSEVERWLRDHMKPAIDAARAALVADKRTKD